MRLAVFTIFRVPNFGSVLQAFATQMCLEEQGHECVFIDYFEKKPKWQKIKVALSPYKIACFLGIRPQFRKPEQLKRFIKQNLNLSKKYEGLKSLRLVDWTNYDALIVGSDQVWNARYHGVANVFLLPFIDGGIKCMSLASSFALNDIPYGMRTVYKKELSKFSAISVREANGVNIVDSLDIGLKAQQILDPTLWLDKEQWLRLCSDNKIIVSHKPYILLYMWTYAFEPRPYIFEAVKYFRDQFGGCDVIALEGSPKESESGMTIIDKADSTIPQFLELFANASLVITSSFHGTAFAINFGRPLVSIVPDENGDDRQSSLLRAVGAYGSIININTPFNRINPYYDMEFVSTNLANLRKESIEWMKKSIV